MQGGKVGVTDRRSLSKWPVAMAETAAAAEPSEEFTDSEEIAELIGACQESSLAENNGLCSSFNGDEDLFVYVTMKNGSQIRSNLDLEKLTSRGKELFTGIPVAF